MRPQQLALPSRQTFLHHSCRRITPQSRFRVAHLSATVVLKPSHCRILTAPLKRCSTLYTKCENALVGRIAKVGHAHSNHGMRTERCRRWLGLVLRRIGRRNLRPRAIHLVVQGRNSNVVSEKFLPAGDECIMRPRIIRECATAIHRTRESHGGLTIAWIEAPVIENDVCRTSRGIDRQPLEELIGAVVSRIRVHAHRIAPGLASIAGSGAEHADVTVAIIAPGDIEESPAAVTQVNRNLRKAVRPFEFRYRKVKRSRFEYGAALGECLAAIMRGREHDGIAIRPNYMQGTVRRDGSGETFDRAIVIARQAMMSADLDRRRPRQTAVG